MQQLHRNGLPSKPSVRGAKYHPRPAPPQDAFQPVTALDLPPYPRILWATIGSRWPGLQKMQRLVVPVDQLKEF